MIEDRNSGTGSIERNTINEEPEQKSGQPYYEQDYEEAPAVYCGNGICDQNENCRDCKRDCGCGDNEFCKDAACVKPACSSDEDCDDGDECTTSFCYFPGHKNSYCYHHERYQCGDLVYYTGGDDNGPKGDSSGSSSGSNQNTGSTGGNGGYGYPS